MFTDRLSSKFALVTKLFSRSIVSTADGSSTLYVPALDEHYHSIHGAVQESLHVFIEAGWMPLIAKHKAISILEVGFGTGLNAWLTARAAAKACATVLYHSLEAYPLSAEEVEALNYAADNPEGDRQLFRQLHEVDWEKQVHLGPYFTMQKMLCQLENWAPSHQYDLIYFDAFAPSAQPELWTEEIFRKLRLAAKEEAVLVTYCAKGSVKRAMKAAGWRVEALPGPPGKREMTRCINCAI
jgi:tRNA U34 5-methylaminomethyl-2-thiouridine-forming methyltransferase MnmC